MSEDHVESTQLFNQELFRATQIQSKSFAVSHSLNIALAALANGTTTKADPTKLETTTTEPGKHHE